MIFLFLACLAPAFVGLRWRRADEDPLAPAVTSSINGIFVLLVMLSHFYQYAGSYLQSAPDAWYAGVRSVMGQIIVSTFLFFSGYGIMHQITKKKRPYARKILTDRLLKVLLHFDLALLLFLGLGFCFGYKNDLATVLKAVIAWSKLSVGNSNWFIFTTFCLYIIVFLAFFFYKEKPLPCLLAVTVLTFVYIALILCSENDSSRFYNTVFCFVGGMWFSYLKEPIRRFWRKSLLCYVGSLAVTVAVGVGSFLLCYGKGAPIYHLLYNLYALAVAMLFTMLAEKLVFGNRLLLWLGKYTFPIYILQRVPYILFRELGLLAYNRILYMIVCVAGTVLFAVGFQYLTDRLDALIWRKK